jgi:hypothetical protein
VAAALISLSLKPQILLLIRNIAKVGSDIRNNSAALWTLDRGAGENIRLGRKKQFGQVVLHDLRMFDARVAVSAGHSP